jgi:undecaprenyl-diphosphatase
MPHARVIAIRAFAGLAALIAILSLIGAFITSLSLTAGIRRWDESVNRWMADGRSHTLIRIGEWFTNMADTRPVVGIIALVTIVLAICRQWRAMLLLPLAMLIEISTFLAVNYIVGRPRPNVSKIGSIPRTYSFPSGHVAATLVCWFGAALLLLAFGRWLLGRVVAALGAIVTVMTGWSRVYLGMHHLLDVLIGLAMGVAALTIAVKALNVHFEHPDPAGFATTRR